MSEPREIDVHHRLRAAARPADHRPRGRRSRERPRSGSTGSPRPTTRRSGSCTWSSTFVFFCLGGIEALLMRVQLSVPNNTLVTPEKYNQLLTMHGTTMIFLFVVPVMAGFGNYFVPLMIGARDMAFPRLNALSFWLLLFGGIVFYATIFFQPPEAGLVELPAAVERAVLAERRPGRVDLPDPHHRHLLARRRDQLLRDDRQHARAGHELGPAAAVRVVDPRLRDPADHRAAGGRRRGHDAADRPPLRAPTSSTPPRTARRSYGSTCSGSSATPRSTS